MLDLRFIGVDDLGAHLLLSDEEGNHFRVPLDASVRGAVGRDRPRQGTLPVEVGAGLRPKEVQAMIRAGLTAEEVAERAGWPVEKVHRYEGPILGEREYVAGLARQVRLRPRGATHGSAPTLDERVSERMRSREIEPATASWDSFRAPSGRWSVVVAFTAGGRQRQAGWDFDQLGRTVSATDDESRWLSADEDGQTPGPVPAPHLQPPARPSQVYDVEAEGGVGEPPKRRRPEPVDLMAAMRERTSQRGRRRRSKAAEAPGLDRVPDEALPLEELAMDPADAGDPPPAHERDADHAGHADNDAADPDEQAGPTEGDEATAESAPPAGLVDEPLPLDEPAAPESADSETTERVDQTLADDEAVVDEGVVDEAVVDLETESTASEPDAPSAGGAGASVGAGHDATDGGAEVVVQESAPLPPASRTASRKSGRPSVPSWDDIMFGRKSD